MNAIRPAALAAFALSLAACATSPGTAMTSNASEPSLHVSGQVVTTHRDGDDLLTAGLGLAGLQAVVPPAFADAAHPTAAEARRRAIWSNWRGIADLSPGGGYGAVYGHAGAVPGREFSALATVPGAKHPHRVLVQVPDAFDAAKRCVVVAPASGSRGVYGAISVAGAWGLPKGCAVAYTDKGAGSDFFDLDAGIGVRVDGTSGAAADGGLAFAPEVPAGAKGVAFRHAHSQDNPEADWGRHVQQAAQYALQVLGEALPDAAPFTFDNTRVIAVGISNGGGAVLRAAELEGSWLDAVVAGEPNIYIDAPGSRALYDYATEAALLQPCALMHLDPASMAQPPMRATVDPWWTLRCATLKALGLVSGETVAEQAKSAYDTMRASGWTDAAMRSGAASSGFDLWRSVAVTYASAYGRYGVGEHPCGYAFSAQNADLSLRPATDAERAAWWSDSAGIPPGNGVNLVDTKMAPPDFTIAGLQCLRALWDGQGADADRVRAGIAETRAALPRAGLPVIVLHGVDDGLVPPAFSSAPYVAAAQAAGREVRYWQVGNAEHFDAFLGFPDYAARYVPMLPYVYAALDRVDAFLDGKGVLPADAVIANKPRGSAALTAADLAIP